jgi:acetolactate synthase I/III small subunit
VAFFVFGPLNRLKGAAMLRTIRVWVENKPGALMRVTGILTAKGINIQELAVAPLSHNPQISEIRLSAEIEQRFHDRVVKEIDRLVNVLETLDVTGAQGLERGERGAA